MKWVMVSPAAQVCSGILQQDSSLLWPLSLSVVSRGFVPPLSVPLLPILYLWFKHSFPLETLPNSPQGWGVPSSFPWLHVHVSVRCFIVTACQFVITR